MLISNEEIDMAIALFQHLKKLPPEWRYDIIVDLQKGAAANE